MHPVQSDETPEVWGLIERVAALTKEMSPQNLKTSKMTEQPVVYCLLTGTRKQIDAFFKRNAKTGKYASKCLIGMYDIIDIDTEMKLLQDMIKSIYLNDEGSNIYVRKGYIFVSEDTREAFENGIELDVQAVRDGMLKHEAPATPPPVSRLEAPSIEPTATDRVREKKPSDSPICGYPTKSGKPCQRKVKGGERCASHRDNVPTPAAPATSTQSIEDLLPSVDPWSCGALTKKGTPCTRKVHRRGDKCHQHKSN